MPEIIPDIRVDDQAFAAANATNINNAIALARTDPGTNRVVLPPGTIWINNIIKGTQQDASLTLEGAGWETILVNLNDAGGDVGGILSIDNPNVGYADAIARVLPGNNAVELSFAAAANYQIGDYAFLFQSQLSGETRSPSQTLKIIDVQGGTDVYFDRNIDSGVYTHAKFMKFGRMVSTHADAGDTSVLLSAPVDASKYKVGDYAFISDGVGLTEIFGEFVKIASVTANPDSTVTVGFLTGLEQSYQDGKTVLIPGPWPQNITVRNLSIGGIRSALQGIWLVKFAPNFLAENVRVWQGGDANQTAKRTDVSVTANARFQNCLWEADTTVNGCHDIHYHDCVIHGAAHDEFTRRVHHINGEIHGFCTAKYGASRVNFLNSRFRRMTQTGVDGFVLTGAGQHSLVNCQFDSGPTHELYVGGGKLFLRDIRSDGQIRVVNGGGNFLENIRSAGKVILADGTGGTVVPPINATLGLEIHDPSEWMIVPTIPGVKPTVTGSRDNNAALASLLTTLAALGIIVDATTLTRDEEACEPAGLAAAR
jgi:hypothetical protein